MSAIRLRKSGLTIALLSCCFLLGCGGEKKFQVGRIAENRPVEPTIRILRPTSTIAARARKKIECEVELQLSRGEALPFAVRVVFVGSRRTFRGGELQPDHFRDATYTFTGKSRAPSTPGKYQIFVEALYVFRTDSNKSPSNVLAKPPSNELAFRQQGPDLEVTK